MHPLVAVVLVGLLVLGFLGGAALPLLYTVIIIVISVVWLWNTSNKLVQFFNFFIIPMLLGFFIGISYTYITAYEPHEPQKESTTIAVDTKDTNETSFDIIKWLNTAPFAKEQ